MPRVVAPSPVFAPQIAELPGAWPACRAARCGSRAAVARIDAPRGPIAIACENGHHRAYAKSDDFRRRGRYAGAFGADALELDVPRERRVETSPRRRAEILEDAERCALCGTPPAEHPFRPDGDVRADRDVWAWLQRWRPVLYADLNQAVTIARQRERITFANWRLKIPPALREAIVRDLEDSALQADHLVPAVRLEQLTGVLTQRELDFAVNRLLVAVCRRCNSGRWHERISREQYLHDYVRALHGGDERVARADAAAWRAMESIAAHAAALRLASDVRSA